MVDSGWKTLNTCEMLDVREKKWMTIAPMQQERHGHVLVNYNGRLLAMGGNDRDNKPLATVEEYNQTSNKWISLEPMKIERCLFAAVVAL